MIFTELRFVLLFVLCWVSFFAVRRNRRAYVLGVWGTIFYFVYAGGFLPLVAGLTLLVLIAQTRAMVWFAGGLITLLLVYFKWSPTGSLTINAAAGASPVLFPLGFSYLTFELLHVLIERRRGLLHDVDAKTLWAFAFFFPSRAAGPIKRYAQFTAAVGEAEASWDNVYTGLVRILIGLFKKTVLADLLALTVAEHTTAASASRAWVVVLAFSFQILLDFSAYSDIAIGFARMLGIKLPENFNWPYFAPNIQQFWNRWHMTLSSWVRDYIFIPCGHRLFKTELRRYPAAIAAISYLLTFVIVGLWHGIAPTFLVWGAYHGVLLACYHVYRQVAPDRLIHHRLYRSRAAGYGGVALTFVLVTVGWVPFMTDWKHATSLLRTMFGGSP